LLDIRGLDIRSASDVIFAIQEIAAVEGHDAIGARCVPAEFSSKPLKMK